MDSGALPDFQPVADVADASGSRPDVPLGPAVRVKLATFNVRNFFDELDDPNKADTVLTAAEVSAKIKKIGASLRRLGADVVALQEIENKGLLTRLRDEELSTLGYEYARLIEGADYRGVDVALLSRFPTPRVISHTRDRFKDVDSGTTTFGFSRDCLEVTIEPSPGRRLVLLINHLAAKDGTTEADQRRLAQAKRVREIADETLALAPGANVAVVGDLNDLPDSRALGLIRSGVVALRDVVERVPAGERYTTTYQGKKEQIDYIIASPGLEANLIQGSVAIDHDPVHEAVSDHYPAVAEFVVE